MTEPEPRNQRGASGVEYGLLLTGVALTIILAVNLFGSRVTSLFTDSCTTITTYAQDAGTCSH